MIVRPPYEGSSGNDLERGTSEQRPFDTEAGCRHEEGGLERLQLCALAG